MPGTTPPQALATNRLAWPRLLTGLAQGGLLYWLYRTTQNHDWPASQPLLFAPLLLLCTLAPVVANSALGQLSRRALASWLAASGVLLAGLGYYGAWHQAKPSHLPAAPLWLACIAGLFIAHALILAAAHDRKRIASYASYFETAWKLLIQVIFSAAFVGGLWLTLWLGSALFMLIQLSFLQDWLRASWFAIPVSVFSFACAMHLTDVRPGIVRGIRGLLLTLFSWILPVALLIVGGFLASLPFTGLEALWATRHATAVLLTSAALLVVLINAAFQDGHAERAPNLPLRAAARLAALALVPLCGIAWYALGLRVAEYGWSSERIYAAACLLLTSVYAAGYAWAACRRQAWLAGIAPVNIGAAWVALGLLLALFSPLADPMRLSVASQLERLKRTAPEHFDFVYLKRHGGRYGQTALQQLSQHSQNPAIRSRALAALADSSDGRTVSARPDFRQHVHTTGAALPDAFFAATWDEQPGLPNCMKTGQSECDAYRIDLDRDGNPEIVLVGREPFSGAAVFTEVRQQWRVLATLPPTLAGCASMHAQLQSGKYQAVAPRLEDLQIGTQRFTLQDRSAGHFSCPQ